MLDTTLLGKVAGIVELAAFLPYLLAILRGDTKPHRVTWWALTAVGVALGASYYASGATDTMWVPVAYVVGPAIVAVLSIRYGVGGSETSDMVAVAIVGVSMALWWWTSSSEVALVASLVADFSALLPTIRKAYRRPGSEDRLAWVMTFVASVLNLLAVEEWMGAVGVYPVYMLIVNGIVVWCLIFRPSWSEEKRQ